MKAKSSAAPTKNAARNHAASPQAQHLVKAHAAVKSVVESPGRPLDAKTQDTMQSRFGYDFSSVRVHTDDKASESARMLGAHAYTTGRHIAFGDGKYAPHTNGGHDLVAHELTHVVQQAHGPVEGTAHGNLSISHPSDYHERDAYNNHFPPGRIQPQAPLALNTALSSSLVVQRRIDVSIGGMAAAAASMFSKSDPKTAQRINQGLAGIAGLSALSKMGGLGTGITVHEGKFPELKSELTIDDYRNAETKLCKVLELTTDKRKTNVAPFFLRFVTCPKGVLSAVLESPGQKGYAGGEGSAAEVWIKYTRLKSAENSPSKKSAFTESEGTESASTESEGTESEGTESEGTIVVEIHGTNTFSKRQSKQTFSGTLLIGGDHVEQIGNATTTKGHYYKEARSSVVAEPTNREQVATSDAHYEYNANYDAFLYVNYGMNAPRVRQFLLAAITGDAKPEGKTGEKAGSDTDPEET